MIEEAFKFVTNKEIFTLDVTQNVLPDDFRLANSRELLIFGCVTVSKYPVIISRLGPCTVLVWVCFSIIIRLVVSPVIELLRGQFLMTMVAVLLTLSVNFNGWVTAGTNR